MGLCQLKPAYGWYDIASETLIWISFNGTQNVPGGVRPKLIGLLAEVDDGNTHWAVKSEEEDRPTFYHYLSTDIGVPISRLAATKPYLCTGQSWTLVPMLFLGGVNGT
jgi:hypothetical protein